MRNLIVSVGGTHNAKVKKTVRCTFDVFVKSLLSNVPETMDKASNGWVCAAEFDPRYRDSKNFVARHLLSFDYDHIDPADVEPILRTYSKYAHLAFTTWTHTAAHPRLRVWLPLSRPCSYDEFQAVSRKVAAQFDIEKMARESHVPAQYYFRPTVKPFSELETWVDTAKPWINVDEVLESYENWTDRKEWPHRADGDGVHNEGVGESPLEKPGIVGAFCRAFAISDAIEKFDLPYKPGSSEGRLTFTQGSRPDGAIVYDSDTKLHSHHDTDPARGQSNAYDLVRLHHFGWLDAGNTQSLGERPSSKAMAELARGQSEVRKQLVSDEGFEDLTLQDTDWDDVGPALESGGGAALPERIKKASSKLTDQENARRIQRKFGEKIISIGGTFYYWTGTHWAQGEQEALRAITNLSAIVQAEAVQLKEKLEAEEKKSNVPTSDEELARVQGLFAWANSCGQAKAINACRALLRDLLAFKSEQLNASSHLFSCANGTLNLRTGDLSAHDPKNFITACSPIIYNPHAQAPRFHRFLNEIFNNNQEVIEFAKRWFGYCLSGDVSEHKMVFHTGGGGNGKSTLMDLLRFVLGSDYYATAPGNLLTLEIKGASPELAGLLGRRMVTIAETEESLELREGLIKQITGGDAITARMLYKNHFEFMPTHKLQVFTNFKPAIKGQDFAIWRRILILEYPNSYGDASQVAAGEAKLLGDPQLESTLQAEAQGVLRWLVEGARDWYADRLGAPAAVQAATQAYRLEQDRPRQFVTERTVASSARTALTGTVGAIFPAYRSWCSSMGYHPLSRTRFELELLRVCPKVRKMQWKEGSTTVIGFEGISLTDSGDML